MGAHHARHLEKRCSLQIVDAAAGFAESITGSVDAVVIAAPTSLHAKLALPLLQAGIPCLIEKPLAASLQEAEALAKYPHAWTGHIERFNPAFSLLSGLSPAFIQADRLAPFSGRSVDVDVILDLMIHDIDLFLSLAPDDPVVDIRASGVAVTTGRLDIAQARLETASGRAATLTASRISPDAERRLRAFQNGTYLSLDLKNHKAHQIRWGEGMTKETLEVPVWDALGRELEIFLLAVQGKAVFPISAKAGLEALKIAAWVQKQIPCAS
jgi:predicted dehydrogenase